MINPKLIAAVLLACLTVAFVCSAVYQAGITKAEDLGAEAQRNTEKENRNRQPRPSLGG